MIRCSCAEAADIRCTTCRAFTCARHLDPEHPTCPRCAHSLIYPLAEALALGAVAHAVQSTSTHSPAFARAVEGARALGLSTETLRYFVAQGRTAKRERRQIADEVAFARRSA